MSSVVKPTHKPTATVFTTRCKNCTFWRQWVGDVPNEAGRRFMNLEAPKRASHACLLRLRDTKTDSGEVIKLPSLDKDQPAGPHYGKRTSPNFRCEYHTRRHAPHRRPGPQVMELPPQVVPDGVQHEVEVLGDAEELV